MCNGTNQVQACTLRKSGVRPWHWWPSTCVSLWLPCARVLYLLVVRRLPSGMKLLFTTDLWYSVTHVLLLCSCGNRALYRKGSALCSDYKPCDDQICTMHAWKTLTVGDTVFANCRIKLDKVNVLGQSCERLWRCKTWNRCLKKPTFAEQGTALCRLMCSWPAKGSAWVCVHISGFYIFCHSSSWALSVGCFIGYLHNGHLRVLQGMKYEKSDCVDSDSCTWRQARLHFWMLHRPAAMGISNFQNMHTIIIMF